MTAYYVAVLLLTANTSVFTFMGWREARVRNAANRIVQNGTVNTAHYSWEKR